MGRRLHWLKSNSNARYFTIFSPEDNDLLNYAVWAGSYIWISSPTIAEHAHRVVAKRMGLEIPTGYDIDHINRNRLDNRRENLRVVTRAINLRNNEAKGITYDKSRNKWSAKVSRNNRTINLGRFPTEELAIEARQRFLTDEKGPIC